MLKKQSCRLLQVAVLIVLLLVASPLLAQSQAQLLTYEEDEVVAAIEGFFGEGAEGIASVVRKIFAEQGEPNAIIVGEEASASIGIGARYGQGILQSKIADEQQVFWQGPSIGVDIGANATKVFTLIYGLESAESLYRRYPGVEGSLYFVGGVGVTYLEAGGTVVAPIRFGAGWRQGVNIGYINYSKKKRLLPF